MSRYRFPWHADNRFVIYQDGPEFYPAMLAQIEAAQQTVCLEMYLFESGEVASRFIDTLCRAAARNIRVYLLLDDFGCRGLNDRDRQRLQKSAIHTVFYNPVHLGKRMKNMMRDHRKLLLVDGRIGFVGGAGIADAFDQGRGGMPPWHEIMVSVEGPVLEDWMLLFAEAWRQWSRIPPPVWEGGQWRKGNMVGRVTCARGLVRQDVKRSLLKHIDGADHRVWLATAYFIPSMRLRRSLKRAAQQGVDVRLLLSGPRTDHPGVRYASHRFFSSLLSKGVRIFEYQGRAQHAKVSLCDDWSAIGSANLDRFTLRWNLEANQEIDDRVFSDQVAGILETDFSLAREIDASRWGHRGWWRHLWEWLWGRIELFLSQHGRGRHRD